MVLRRALLCALALSACDKKPSVPSAAPPSAALPPLEEKNPHAAAPSERPVHEPSGQGSAGLPVGHPPLGGGGGGSMGSPEQTTPGNIAFDPKTVVSGVIRLDDKVKDKVKAGDVIYLVARNAEQPGPPLAVKRLVAQSWPVTFQLDGRDAMIEGTKMAGKVTVNARVDKDGDAATKTPGDVSGTSRAIALPADKVVITLDTVL
jgi:hypothetical protein